MRMYDLILKKKKWGRIKQRGNKLFYFRIY